MALHKERIENFKTNRLKNLKSLNTRTGSYSALASQNMKIVDFLATIVLNAQTFFFVPIVKDYEIFEENTPLYEKCIK
jgi:hypothetical protein